MIRAPVHDALKISHDAIYRSDFALKYKLFIINYKFWINAEISRQNEGVISHLWHYQREHSRRGKVVRSDIIHSNSVSMYIGKILTDGSEFP